ncbi:hypothetical protein [Pectobacterium polonicum]|uniref:hypothetical protein n=1 Tax=Pectobacterium polonicum TaxID=2485124 RepID=UPI002B2438EF|nr:hypothetical protein [Pectobacterium polonicum]
MSLLKSVIRVTNLPGADLNAACSGTLGRVFERSQRTCNLKYDEYSEDIESLNRLNNKEGLRRNETLRNKIVKWEIVLPKIESEKTLNEARKMINRNKPENVSTIAIAKCR